MAGLTLATAEGGRYPLLIDSDSYSVSLPVMMTVSLVVPPHYQVVIPHARFAVPPHDASRETARGKRRPGGAAMPTLGVCFVAGLPPCRVAGRAVRGAPALLAGSCLC